MFFKAFISELSMSPKVSWLGYLIEIFVNEVSKNLKLKPINEKSTYYALLKGYRANFYFFMTGFVCICIKMPYQLSNYDKTLMTSLSMYIGSY